MKPIEIAKYVFKMEQVDWELHLSHSRHRDIVQARQRAMWLIRHFCPTMTYQKIAKLFSKNHATIMYACDVVTDFISIDPEYAKKMALYQAMVRDMMNKKLFHHPDKMVQKLITSTGDPCKMITEIKEKDGEKYILIRKLVLSKDDRLILSGFNPIRIVGDKQLWQQIFAIKQSTWNQINEFINK